MNIKKTKISKAIYSLFFGKSKHSQRTKTPTTSSTAQTSGKKQKQATSASIQRNASRKTKYDLSHLHEQVSETEYIANLRLGRSWIFPKMVKMGFVKRRDKSYVFDITEFMNSFHKQYGSSVQKRRQVWSLMKRNYAAIAKSDETDVRAKWWTKELFLDILNWDRSITGRRTAGFNVEECRKIISTAGDLCGFGQLSAAIDWYDVNRMRCREGNYPNLPDSFVNAFLADGAYHSMMTMVKVYNLRLKNDADESLSRDESIAEIEKQGEALTGMDLLVYCKEKFFDSGIFEYDRYC